MGELAATALYTCVVKCKVCNAELNRAVHVPFEHRDEVIKRTAATVSMCEVNEHNTAEDHNLNIVLEWYAEGADALTLVRVESPPE